MNANDIPESPPLQRSLSLLTLAGCLGMIYSTTASCPAFTDFLRHLGVTELQFGLIGGIPMVMLALQFAGAIVTNSVRSRKRLFMTVGIVGRALFLLVALLPWLWPDAGRTFLIWAIIGLLALSAASGNLTGPLGLSWMADLIPRRVLGRYWGQRQRWQYFAWTLSYVAMTAFTMLSGLPITIAFPVLAFLGVIAGVVDFCLFRWIHEPENHVVRGKSILATMLAPFQHRSYRSFVLFSCVWTSAVMFAATFMQLFVLKIWAVPVWKTLIIWTFSGIGMTACSAEWGRLANRFGHKPILAICTGLKPLILLVFLFGSAQSALLLLSASFLVDSMLNAGNQVATNGYMMKIAPRENRSMFIAAISGLAGICGGLGAMAGGAFLHACSGFEITLLGRVWNNYHLLFAVNFFMRAACIVLAYRVREPGSSAPEDVLDELGDSWAVRFLLFPAGLYRRLGLQWEDDQADHPS